MGKLSEKNLHRELFSLSAVHSMLSYHTDKDFFSLEASDVLEHERDTGGKPSNMFNKITVDPFDFTNRFDSFRGMSISNFRSLISFTLRLAGLSIETEYKALRRNSIIKPSKKLPGIN